MFCGLSPYRIQGKRALIFDQRLNFWGLMVGTSQNPILQNFRQNFAAPETKSYIYLVVDFITEFDTTHVTFT